MMAFRIVTPTLGLLVHDNVAPTDTEWNAWLLTIQGVRENSFGCLVTTEGGAPTRTQQMQFGKMLDGRVIPVGVVSDRPIVRFVVSAMAFINDGVRSFAPGEISSALAWVRADAQAYGPLRNEGRAILAANPGKLRTLDAIVKHLA